MPNACSANAEGIDHAASHVPTHRFDSHCEELRTAWLESARVGEAVRWASDKFGTGYTVDFEMVRSTKRARVRGAWIVRMDDGLPRLTSCYVL